MQRIVSFSLIFLWFFSTSFAGGQVPNADTTSIPDFSGQFEDFSFCGEQYITQAYAPLKNFVNQKIVPFIPAQAQLAAENITLAGLKALQFTLTALGDPALVTTDLLKIGKYYAQKTATEKFSEGAGSVVGAIQDGIKANVQPKIDAAVQEVKKDVSSKIKKAAIGLVLGYVAYKGARFLISKYNASRFIPSLAYASSESSFFTKRSLPGALILTQKRQKAFDQYVHRARNISVALESDKDISYQNILLVGQGGTGKSHYAQKLAITSGLDYYAFNAASFFRGASHVCNEFIDWAEKRTNGTIVIIDDIDLFTIKQRQVDISRFLEYIRCGSSKIMFIFTTKVPHAILDLFKQSIQEVVPFVLPGQKERRLIIDDCCSAVLMGNDATDLWKISIDLALHEEKRNELAIATEGFSGGEIKTYVQSIKTACKAKALGVVTSQIIDEELERALIKRTQLNLDKVEEVEL